MIAAKIRHMTPEDVERAEAIATQLPNAPHWPTKAYRAAASHSLALVAESSTGAVVGFAIASLIPPESELESIVVAREFQRQCVALQLMVALIAELSAAGITELLLEVRASNAAALGFYRTVGFEQTGLRRGYYVHPVDDAVLMRRAIS